MHFDIMGGLQKLGRSLMLPIAVLPVAGLLLRLGQPDLLDIAFIADAGNAIFANLALIFAIGLAVGFANDSNGAAGLAGVVGYLVLDAVLHTLNADINMGVLSGIIIGAVAGGLYNRFKDIKLPEYLAFFGGRRFVPIVTGLAAVLLGMLFGVIWPTVQTGIDTLGQWLIQAGDLGLFVYGVLNRLLIVTGLHHVLNSFVWFVFGSFDGATGDLNRFFAGDPSAGSFMAGFFPVMMFGLPAAALAMYHAAPIARRHQVGGLLLSLALTAFLTGVTEPIEFTFMFLAPGLYALHAVLTGLSMVVMHLLDVKLGFTFSAGAFDYALSYGLSTNGWLMIPVGLAYAVIYYGVFRWAIVRFDLPTPGREPESATTRDAAVDVGERGPAFVRALGGAANLTSVGACTTRLRLVLGDAAAIDEPMLKRLGARGVLHLRGGGLQVVLGPIADGVADEIRAAMAAEGAVPTSAADVEPASAISESPALTEDEGERWWTALGGRRNVCEAEAVAVTRVRLRLADGERFDEAALQALGASGVQRLGDDLIHVLLGERAGSVARYLAPS
ncbi:MULTISPECIES: N-acetylglucosamine-specific PTS transporter subunit IIBC [unclassified Modicisalibacter]|uniref:N-acetylglucosamine-specific PTS transporter subunit IIBC n=1 Tax=unclassified Modicisalibacter TaxID=2679913 RepID=UPI001CC98995|nr:MULTISPECIES: N-acetylglucosamine-specific PTS transporter subunit IIBC [unclassified Modicisalibacter]MBZ9560050.1 N-acetylglucosamine-specific PTS transporter subunit IIBC [Modicisalibacter sp. R2A 31.J]MBZ9575959.1 N-acetylglucosamine-specific PTS transporter subunit IIBC [Modicisalibacter sp. MOD 31.J]